MRSRASRGDPRGAGVAQSWAPRVSRGDRGGPTPPSLPGRLRWPPPPRSQVVESQQGGRGDRPSSGSSHTTSSFLHIQCSLSPDSPLLPLAFFSSSFRPRHTCPILSEVLPVPCASKLKPTIWSPLPKRPVLFPCGVSQLVMTRARVRISAKSPFPRSLSAPSVTATVAAGTASASFITLSTLGDAQNPAGI